MISIWFKDLLTKEINVQVKNAQGKTKTLKNVDIRTEIVNLKPLVRKKFKFGDDIEIQHFIHRGKILQDSQKVGGIGLDSKHFIMIITKRIGKKKINLAQMFSKFFMDIYILFMFFTFKINFKTELKVSHSKKKRSILRRFVDVLINAINSACMFLVFSFFYFVNFRM